MRILTISNYFPNHPGGIEFVALNLVSRWRENIQVRWMACDVAADPYNNHVDDLPLKAYNFAETRLGFPYPFPTLRSIPMIFKQVRWSDVVHIHDCLYFTSIVAFFISRFFSKPIVVTQHVGLVPYREKIKRALQLLAYQTIGRLMLKRADEVVFVNTHVRDWFETEIGIQRTLVIQNGVDNRIFYPADSSERRKVRNGLGYSQDDILLLFIGRFTQKKGIHLVKEVALNRPCYHWIMIGRGDIDVSRWNLPNIRIFPSRPQTDLRDFYIAADLLVLPSTGEGFPLTVQEALSCGLPAAVSAEVAASMPDAPLVTLVTSSLHQILQVLDKVVNESAHRLILQDQSKIFARQWDWGIAARKYEELFVHLANRYSSGSSWDSSADRE